MEIFKKSNNSDCAENEEYQECGKKCVLGCKNSSSSLGITLSEEECEKTECVKGCFCKDGFARQQDKCVPVSECSSRQSREYEYVIVDTSVNSELSRRGYKPYGCGPSGCYSSYTTCGSGGCGSTCGPNGCVPAVHINNHNHAAACKNNLKIFFVQICVTIRV